MTKKRLSPLAQLVAGVQPPAPTSTTPQAEHHFTTMKQIDELVRTTEVEADRGYLMRLAMLCSMPRTNPGTRLQYKRVNGPYKLYMLAGGDNRLPYGNLPRLLLAWVCTEAVRTQSRELVLGRSLDEFMRKLGIKSRSGGPRGMRTQLRNQMQRLFRCHVELVEEHSRGSRSVAGVVAGRTEFWWNPGRPDEPVLWDSTIELGEELFNEIINHPIPVDLNVLKAMKRSTLGLDLYAWLTYKTFGMRHPLRLPWKQLYVQFGADPAKAGESRTVQNFRAKAVRELRKLKGAWPGFDYSLPRGALVIHPAEPLIAPRA